MHNAQPTSWKTTAGLVTLGIGVLGFIASAAVGGGPSLEGAILAGALNPLFFIGAPLGLYWLLTATPQAKEPESQLRDNHTSKSAAIAFPVTAATIPSEIEFRPAQNCGVGAVSVLALVSASLVAGGAIGFKLGLDSSTLSTVRTPPTSTLAEDDTPLVQIPTAKPGDNRNALAEPTASATGHDPEKGKRHICLSFTQSHLGQISTFPETKHNIWQVQIGFNVMPENAEYGSFAILGAALQEKNLLRVRYALRDSIVCEIDRSVTKSLPKIRSLVTYVESPTYKRESSPSDHDLAYLRLTFPAAECGEVIETSPQWRVRFPRQTKTSLGDILLIYRCRDDFKTSFAAAVRVSEVNPDSTHFSVEPARIKRDWNTQSPQAGDFALYLGEPRQ